MAASLLPTGEFYSLDIRNFLAGHLSMKLRTLKFSLVFSSSTVLTPFEKSRLSVELTKESTNQQRQLPM